MNSTIKEKIINLENREEFPQYVKYKEKPELGKHLINCKNEIEYRYYKCDFCEKEIIIKEKKDEQDGGIIILPNSLTKRGRIKIALHNKCLNPLLKQF